MTTVDYNDFTRHLMDDIRQHGGPTSGPMAGRPLMILTTSGAKTGEPRTAVVTYHRDGDRYVIAASKSGAPDNPAWYHNLVKHRDAEVEVGTEKFKVRATPIAKGPERDRLYEAHGDNFAAFRDYPKKTKRVIPVVVLERV